ncbi:MAG: twin arginine-targeting protein translocase TatB [Rhizobium sp.]|nr:twin arginine-targeting protein translocase TatB [Rhizobium sp.]
MLEVGWSEILVIALILIIVVGPKDLPGMLRTFGKMATRMRGMANEFKGQFDQALREADLDDVRKGLSEVSKLNPTNSLRDAMNPIRKLGEDIKSDLQKASDMTPPVTATPPNTVTAVTPAAETAATPAIEPIAAAATPAAVEKIAEPAPLAQPLAANVIETPPAKPKTTRRRAAEPKSLSDAAVADPVLAKPATRKAPVRIKDAAVAAVAAEAAATKPASRKNPAIAFTPDIAASENTKPKRAAARKTTMKAGDA